MFPLVSVGPRQDGLSEPLRWVGPGRRTWVALVTGGQRPIPTSESLEPRSLGRYAPGTTVRGTGEVCGDTGVGTKGLRDGVGVVYNQKLGTCVGVKRQILLVLGCVRGSFGIGPKTWVGAVKKSVAGRSVARPTFITTKRGSKTL